MTGRASEISEADERSEGSYRAGLARASHPGNILTHCSFLIFNFLFKFSVHEMLTVS